MGFRHEPKRFTGSWVFPNRNGSRVAAIFTGEDVRTTPYQGYFLRYEGPEPAPTGALSWKRNPTGWFELRPHEPLLARSSEEAKALLEPLWAGVEDGSSSRLFEKRPFVPPERPVHVREIEHPTHHARAAISRWPEGHYEVGYLVYAPNGSYLPASTPGISSSLEWEWGVTWAADEDGGALRTLADDEASAEQIAVLELDAIVRKDPRIRGKQQPT